MGGYLPTFDGKRCSTICATNATVFKQHELHDPKSTNVCELHSFDPFNFFSENLIFSRVFVNSDQQIIQEIESIAHKNPMMILVATSTDSRRNADL